MDEQRERMAWLCQRIQVENDQQKFTQLVSELNELLSRAEDEKQRFSPTSNAGQPSPLSDSER